MGWNGTLEKGRPKHYAELARDVVNTHPDLIFAAGVRLSLDFKMATTTIPIVTISHRSDCRRTCGKHRAAGRQHHRRYHGWRDWNSLENVWGCWSRRCPKLSTVGYLASRSFWQRPKKCGNERGGQKGRGLALSPAMLGSFSEPEYQRVFRSMEQDRADALMVSDEAEHCYQSFDDCRIGGERPDPLQFILYREFIEVGGLTGLFDRHGRTSFAAAPTSSIRF